MAEEIEEKKKKKDKADKKEKKEKKKKDNQDEDFEEEKESVGSRFALAIITILIIAIWLGIFGVIIKFDVGGFGSTVLTPLLEDVPVLNMILPEKEEIDPEEAEKYNYDSLDDAIKDIKRLEAELEAAKAQNTTDKETIAKQQEENDSLMKYKEEQAAFEKLKEKFYEEVVFSDNAPDINEYKMYYEGIDPENAQILYKQVVEQIQESAEIKEYAKRYSSMKPKEAAEIFNKMTDDLKLVAKILGAMSTQESADILAKMDKETAAKVTKIMEP